MEISIEGVVEVNYHLVIDEDVFNDACEEAGLDPANFKKFSKDDWDIFYRIFVNQEKATEVAASLNVSKNVVYIVHCRVKQKFTEILKELTDVF